MTDYKELIERAKDQRDRDVAEHCPAEIIALQDEVIAGLEALLDRLEKAEKQVDALLQHCPDSECLTCGGIICPHGEPMHFHHDGCPACAQNEAMEASK